MWPFSRSGSEGIDERIEQAIAFAGEQWRDYARTSPLAPNIHLRDRIAYFAGPFTKVLHATFPDLAAAPEQVLLLIIACGIERSGDVSRRMIEVQLGIVLPPS